MNTTQSFFEFFQKIQPTLHAIKTAGGTSYLVGGCVRDLVLNRPLKDFDIEVHNLALEQLEAILTQSNHVRLVGKKFGVLRIDGLDVDWSLPRRDSKGRKPEVAIDPFMTIQEACKRRDVTMNAMAIDLNEVSENPAHVLRCFDKAQHKLFDSEIEAPLGLSKRSASKAQDERDKIALVVSSSNHSNALKIIDPYGGLEDIKHNRLRAIDKNLFLEDPLRFFRIMQFIGRFEMEPDAGLNEICATMSLWDTQTNTPLARERIFEEIKKLFLKSNRPSLGFRWLRSINRLAETFPELSNLITIKQPEQHHPEGDVFEHTMQALDASAQLPYYQNQSPDIKLIIMFATLCHDLGKAITTDEQCHAYGHEEKGVDLAYSLLKRITDDHVLIQSTKKLVRHHLAPFTLIHENASPKAYKRLANKLAPEVSLNQLALVALADRQGRNGANHEPLIEIGHDLYQEFLHKAELAEVAHGPEAPILLGRHLLDVIQPGEELGRLLKAAYHIQIEEGIKDPEMLRERALALRR